MQVNRPQTTLSTAIAAYQTAEAHVVTVVNQLAQSPSITGRLVASTEGPRFYKPGASQARALIAGIVAALPTEASQQLRDAKSAALAAKGELTSAMHTTLEQIRTVERDGAKPAPGYAESKRIAQNFLHSEDGLMFIARPKTMPEIQTWMLYIAVADCLG